MKLLRHTSPDPQQLSLQLDFFSPDFSSQPKIDHPAPTHAPEALHRPQTPPVETPKPVPNGKRRVQLGEHTLDYVLVRSKRRSIGFMIDDDGLRITAPKWVTLTEIENAICEKQRWIFTKLNERRERSARRLQPQMEWRDGSKLPYLGEDITLRILSTQSAGILYDHASKELTVCLPFDAAERQLKDRVQGWLQLEAKRIFA